MTNTADIETRTDLFTSNKTVTGDDGKGLKVTAKFDQDASGTWNIFECECNGEPVDPETLDCDEDELSELEKNIAALTKKVIEHANK